MSRLCPQGRLLRLHHTRSGGCGFVANRSPQAVDRIFVHRAGGRLSTGSPQPGPSCPQLLHTLVHCSATKRPRSLGRVKAVTPRGSVGLWGTWVKLGTALGRSTPVLCIGCAELFAVHRTAGFSTGSTHRCGGQKTGVDLRKRGFPPFPQDLLLLPTIVSWESASKWGLCTTRHRSPRGGLSRLDPDPHRVTVAADRLAPGNKPTTRPAGRASNSRRRFR